MCPPPPPLPAGAPKKPALDRVNWKKGKLETERSFAYNVRSQRVLCLVVGRAGIPGLGSLPYPCPVVVPDQESPHVPNNKGKSGCCRACRHPMCVVVRSSLIDKQAKKMQPAQDVVGEAIITWPGAGRCRRTIADVDEPSKEPQLFIFGVPFVRIRLLSDDED